MNNCLRVVTTTYGLHLHLQTPFERSNEICVYEIIQEDTIMLPRTHTNDLKGTLIHRTLWNYQHGEEFGIN